MWRLFLRDRPTSRSAPTFLPIFFPSSGAHSSSRRRGLKGLYVCVASFAFKRKTRRNLFYLSFFFSLEKNYEFFVVVVVEGFSLLCWPVVVAWNVLLCDVHTRKVNRWDVVPWPKTSTAFIFFFKTFLCNRFRFLRFHFEQRHTNAV